MLQGCLRAEGTQLNWNSRLWNMEDVFPRFSLAISILQYPILATNVGIIKKLLK